MTDKRWEKLGELLINHSLEVKPGEKVMVMMLETDTYPLAKAVYAACIKAGGYCQIQFMSEAIKHQILKYGNDEQISWIPEIEAYGMDWADCYLGLRGGFNLNECYDIPNEKLAKYQKAMGIISAKRTANTRWALVRVPNERFAQQANVSYDKMMDMFFDACDVDWDAQTSKWQPIVDTMNKGETFHIVAPNTDLTIKTKPDWVYSTDHSNIPGAELYCTPQFDGLNGYITFEFPATIGGKVIHDMRLEFVDGVCVKCTAKDNEEYANNILDSDDFSRHVGEFAFGINPGIDIITTDILIDEKFGGTMHIAMGRPYDGSYTSAIHWDIIKDLRTDSEITLDGKLIYKNGEFVI